MELGALIKRLQELEAIHGSAIEVFYMGLNSPIAGAVDWEQSRTEQTFILLENYDA